MMPTLIYAYDPLCGWCFGFHPIIKKIAERFQDRLNIRVVPGGLAVDENAQTISEGYSYIQGALKQTEETTGVEFGENFKFLVEEGSYYYDSEPACIAQTTANKLASDKALEFAEKLHNAIFVDGKNLNETDTFLEIAEDLNMDISAFEKTFNLEATRKGTRNGFDWCKKMGATAFPTILLELGDETGLISRGYRPFDTIESHLHHLLNNFERMSKA